MKTQEVNIKLIAREGVAGFGLAVDGIDDEIVAKLLNLEDPPELGHLTDLQLLGLKALIAIVETLQEWVNNDCDVKQRIIN